MKGLLIANKDKLARDTIAAKVASDDYRISTTDSVVNSLENILDKSVQVVLLSGVFDENYVAKFVPLLKKCNRHLAIILMTDEIPLELLRHIRKEGIFYHALQPAGADSWDEIREAIACAFETYQAQEKIGCGRFRLARVRGLLSTLCIGGPLL